MESKRAGDHSGKKQRDSYRLLRIGELQHFVDVVPDAAVICDEGGRILCANAGSRDLFSEDDLGSEIFELVEFIPQLTRTVSPDFFVTAARAGAFDQDLSLLSKDGRDLEVWFSTSRLKTGGDAYFVLVTMRDITERKSHEKTLRLFSMTDDLTRLHNRRYLRVHGGVEMERATRFGFDVVCIFIDLDDFKAINDEHGHRIGDRVLVAVAGILTKRTRQVDLLCRFGGDEFVLIGLVKGRENAKVLVERVSESPLEIATSAGSLAISITCGAVYTAAPRDAKIDDLVDRADKQMIAGKRPGKGRGLFFDLDRNE